MMTGMKSISNASPNGNSGTGGIDGLITRPAETCFFSDLSYIVVNDFLQPLWNMFFLRKLLKCANHLRLETYKIR